MNGYGDLQNNLNEPVSNHSALGRIIIQVLERQADELASGSDRRCLRRACQILLNQQEHGYNDVQTQTEELLENALENVTDIKRENVMTQQQTRDSPVASVKEERNIEQGLLQDDGHDQATKPTFHGRVLLKGDGIKPRTIPLKSLTADLSDPRTRADKQSDQVMPETSSVGMNDEDDEVEILGEVVRILRPIKSSKSCTTNEQQSQMEIETNKQENTRVKSESRQPYPNLASTSTSTTVPIAINRSKVEIETISSPEDRESVDMEISDIENTDSQIAINIPVFNNPPITPNQIYRFGPPLVPNGIQQQQRLIRQVPHFNPFVKREPH